MAAGRAPVRRAAPAPATRSPARRRPGQAPNRGQQRYGGGGGGGAGKVATDNASVAAPGCAVVSAEWLLQLRDEVDTVVRSAASSPRAPDVQAKEAAPVTRAGVPRVASAKRLRDRGPRARNAATPSPMAEHLVAEQSPRLQNAAVGTDDEEAKTSVEPAQGVRSQSTQTPSAERIGQLSAGGALPAPQQKAAPAERVGTCSVGSQVQAVTSHAPASASCSPTRMAPNPNAESPHGLGRCDLFGRDQDHAEVERERRRLQAQMLAEQIEEQRKRKEEEKRKRKEEELLEEQRIEREQRELAERHAREKGRAKNGPRGQANGDTGAPGGQVDPTQGGRSPEQRKRTPLRTDLQQGPPQGAPQGSPQGAPQNTPQAAPHGVPPVAPTAAESSSFWADAGAPADATGVRRRRRKRRTDASTGTTWRSGHQQSWRDPQVDSTGIPPQSRRHSQSPDPPWLSETGQASVTAETRQRRRRVRERVREKDRQETNYVEQWVTPSAASGRPPGEDSAPWSQDDEHRAVRNPGGKGRRQRSGSHPQVDERVHADGQSPPLLDRKSPKISEEKLQEQLGSLVNLCEQLLKERAERDRLDRERFERDRLDRMERGERTERSVRSERGDRSERGERSKRNEHDSDRAVRAVGSGAALEEGAPRGPGQRSSSRKRSASKHLLAHDSQFQMPGSPGREERWSPRAPHNVAAAAPNGGAPNSGRNSGAVSARSHGSQGAKARSHSGRSRTGHAGQGNHASGEGAGHGGPDGAVNGQRSAGRPPPLLPDQDTIGVHHRPPQLLPDQDTVGVHHRPPQLLPDQDWPPDALAGFMAEAAVHPASNEAAAPRSRPRRLGDIEEWPSPFAVPNARGMAMPRHSLGMVPQLVMSPPHPVSRGGLNLQAHWPAFGRLSFDGPSEDAAPPPAPTVGAKEVVAGPGFEAEHQRGLYGNVAYRNANFGSAAPGGVSNGEALRDAGDWYKSPGPKHVGPGHIPIEIRPSIQAQSAMLRELYPRGPLAAGAAGPLPAR